MQSILRTLCCCIMLFLAAQALGAEKEFRVGVWLNHSLMAKGDDEIRAFLDDAKSRGINEIYPNFWFQGAVSYAGSEFAPLHPKFNGKDHLKVVIAEAKARGMRVYPWAEYGFFVHFNRTNIDTEAGPILEKNPDWGVLSKEGKPSVYNKGLGVAHFSINPGKAEARKFLLDLCMEMMRLHPEVDGLHLDRIRYQGEDFSYDPHSLAQFKALTGMDAHASTTDAAVLAAFTSYREDQTNAFMKEIHTAFKKEYPTKELNGAVTPPYIQKEKFQRWDVWMANGWMDTTSPMIYGGLTLVRQEIDRTLELVPHPERLLAGLDVSAGEEALQQSIAYAREKGFAGVVLWDDLTLLKVKPNLFAEPKEVAPAIEENTAKERETQRDLY